MTLQKETTSLLVSFTQAHKRLIILVCTLFVTLTSLNIHGFSLSVWHGYIDKTQAKEVLVGTEQGIRSDDWLAVLPFRFSQHEHVPSFPLINRLAGDGHNMLLIGDLVAHPLAIFRPNLWGYFVGPDFGMSWDWYTRSLGFFYAFFLFFMLLTGSQFEFSILLAISLLFAPYFQYWSLHGEPMTTFFALCVVFASNMFLHPSKKIAAIYSVLLGWAGGGFALALIYPPSQVILGYLFLILLVGILSAGEFHRNSRTFIWERLRLSIIPISIVLLAVAYFYFETKDAIALMSNTVYPGRRSIANGGDFPLTKIVSNSFFPQLRVRHWGGFFPNICEASFFIFYSPPILLLLLYKWKHLARTTKIFFGAALAYFVFVAMWMFVGVPEWFSKATFLNNVPTSRAIVGLGIIDMVFVALCFRADVRHQLQSSRVAKLVAICFWVATIIYYGLQISAGEVDIKPHRVILCGILFGSICYLILKQSRLALVSVAIVSLMASFKFNPIVKGGADYLYGNFLSTALIDTNAEFVKREHRQPKWLVFGSFVYPTLLRALGLKTINGLHYYPQFSIWKILDPDGAFMSSYNRHAHIEFEPIRGSEISYAVLNPDLLNVKIDPSNSKIQQLGAELVLFNGYDASILTESPLFKQVWKMNEFSIFERRR